MKKEEILALFEQFEKAACEVNQVECWSARELQKLLGYSKWENFSNVIVKAKDACANVGHEVSDHFPDVKKMVVLGSGAERDVDDILLTRYACYLVAQNGDPRKPQIGEQVTFDPTGLVVKVASDDSIEYEGRIYKLSPFVGTFMPEEHRNASGAFPTWL